MSVPAFRATLIACLLGLVACGPGSQGESSSSGDSGDSGNLQSDAELRASCASGCVRFKACAPAAYDGAYADDQACEDFCFDLFDAPDACRAASVPYAACTVALECVDWPDLLSDPAMSMCSAAWADVMTACPDL